jgi:hypothetical protein
MGLTEHVLDDEIVLVSILRKNDRKMDEKNDEEMNSIRTNAT